MRQTFCNTILIQARLIILHSPLTLLKSLYRPSSRLLLSLLRPLLIAIFHLNQGLSRHQLTAFLSQPNLNLASFHGHPQRHLSIAKHQAFSRLFSIDVAENLLMMDRHPLLTTTLHPLHLLRKIIFYFDVVQSQTLRRLRNSHPDLQRTSPISLKARIPMRNPSLFLVSFLSQGYQPRALISLYLSIGNGLTNPSSYQMRKSELEDGERLKKPRYKSRNEHCRKNKTDSLD